MKRFLILLVFFLGSCASRKAAKEQCYFDGLYSSQLMSNYENCKQALDNCEKSQQDYRVGYDIYRDLYDMHRASENVK